MKFSTSFSFFNRIPFRFYTFRGTAQKIFPKLFDSPPLHGVVYIHAHSVEYFNLLNSPVHRLEYTESRAFINFPVFYLTKHSKYRIVFNHQLSLFIESGLIEYWSAKFLDRNRFEKHDKRPQKFGMGGITAILKICASLYLISIWIFIAEILSEKCIFLKKVIESLTY